MRAALVIVAWTTLAHADGETAAEHAERGRRLYEQGELDAAIAELERANAIEVTPEACYTLGQAWRKKGDCARAIESYRCAVERAPNPDFASRANYQIGRCVVESRLDPHDKAPPIVIAVDRPVAQPRPPWYRDLAGGVLLGLGVGAAGVGGGLLVHAQLRAADASDDLQAYRDAQNVGTERLAGGISLSVGAALVVGSIIRYTIVARRR